MKSEVVDELIGVAKFILGFLPWIVFLLLPTDGWEPLRRAVVICLVLSVAFSIKDLRRGFVLQWASTLFFLFTAVALYGFRWVWLAEHMEIIANGFLVGIIWLSIFIGKPFTLQYARAELPRERWYDENLVKGCRFIAVFWGTLLLIPAAASIYRLYHPLVLPSRFYFFLSLSCIITGVIFTSLYKRMKRQQRQSVV